jgi:hypothetical protein
MGLRFDLMFRLGILGQLPRQADGESVLSLYPGCRQVLRDGSVIEKASYAYPEVQGFMLDLIREVTTVIDADGINLCSVRGPHLLCYEAPILEAFQARYQTDARQVEPQDPRLLAVRAGFMTAFMRSTRKVLDEVGAAKGRRLELSVWVWPGNQNVWLGKTPIEEGLDVKGWIQEGLLDSLICQQGVDADYLRLGEQNHCPFILFPGYHGDQAISPRTLTAGYAAGARHFACWDIDCLQVRPEVWPWLRRTGHPDELEAWDPGAHEPRLIRLHRVDGVDVLNGFADAVYSGG